MCISSVPPVRPYLVFHLSSAPVALPQVSWNVLARPWREEAALRTGLAPCLSESYFGIFSIVPGCMNKGPSPCLPCPCHHTGTPANLWAGRQLATR